MFRGPLAFRKYSCDILQAETHHQSVAKISPKYTVKFMTGSTPRYHRMSSGMSLSDTSVYWKSPDIKTIYRAAHKVTGPFAKSLVQQSGVISAASNAGGDRLKLLDQACGTGVVAEALHNEFASAHAEGVTPNWQLKCTDISPPMLESIGELIAKNKWENVEVANSNILDNGLDANTFDYVFTSFGMRYEHIYLCQHVSRTEKSLS